MFGKKNNINNDVVLNSLDNEMFKKFFENNPLPMWYYDLKSWKFLSVNDAAVNYFGYSRDEFSRMTIKDMRPDEELPLLLENVKTYNDPEPQGQSFRYKLKDGSIVPVTLITHDINSNGYSVRAVILKDIKELQNDVKPVNEITGRFRIGLSMGKFATWEIDLSSGHILYDERTNENFKQILGYYKTHNDFLNLLHPDDLIQMKQIILDLIKGRADRFEIEYRAKTSADTYNWFRDIGGVVERNIRTGLIRLMGMTEDINERKQAHELQSNQNEMKFRAIFYNSPDIIMMTDIKGNIKAINRVPQDYSSDDVHGKNFLNFLPDELSEKFKKAIDAAISTKSQISLETRITTPKGRVVDWFNGIFTVFENNKPTELIINCTDVTEIKKTTELIRENEQRFQKFFEFGLTGNFISTSDGKLLLANKRYKEIFGYNVDEDIRKSSTMSLYTNTADRQILVEKILKEKQVQDYELKMRRRDGRIIYILANVIGQFDQSGKLERLIGYVIDNTERKFAFNRIKQLSVAVEQSPASVVITDTVGNIQYANPKCLELTGYTFDEVVGKNPRVFKSGETTSNEYNVLWKTITSGGTWRGEFHNKKKNGELYWEYAIISPILDQKGRIINFLAVKEDVTDNKKMMKELISAKEKAEQINRIKSNFFSNMSHELRTPLTGILGYTELLLDDVQNEEQERMLDSIHQSGERLLDTLNKILHISKIESETLIPKLERVYLPNKIKTVVNELNAAAIKKGLFIKVNFEYDNLYANLDREMLRIILSNLVMNAIKFTKVGGINISCRSTFVEERHRVFVCVEDTGIGIHPSNQSTIFEEFRQASEGLSRNYEGTGLGLTIVKKYTELLGGKITVQSELEKGTKFTLEFPGAFKVNDENINPNKSAVKSVVENVTPAAGEKPVLLLVEDDPITSEVMAKQLQEEFIINTSNCGEHALESISLKKYDAILMDISLGKGMNGLETTKNIRLVPGYETIPIAAVTAFAMNGEKEKFISAGLTDYISKPFTKVEFIKFVRKILDKHKK